jgi:hypothetical protein
MRAVLLLQMELCGQAAAAVSVRLCEICKWIDV